MAVFYEYNREAAVSYARRWALGRNPAYMDYELWDGDCTNIISQSLRSGQKVLALGYLLLLLIVQPFQEKTPSY